MFGADVATRVERVVNELIESIDVCLRRAVTVPALIDSERRDPSSGERPRDVSIALGVFSEPMKDEECCARRRGEFGEGAVRHSATH